MIFIHILIVLSYFGNVYYANHYNSLLLSIHSNEFGTFLKFADTSYSDARNEISVLLSVSDVSDVTYTDEPVENISSLDSSEQSTKIADIAEYIHERQSFISVSRLKPILPGSE